MQILYQMLSIVIGAVYSFAVTYIIVYTIGLIPFMRLRLNEEEEKM
jgi:ammonia channel protein AmtB